ncbi:MAG: cyclic pyranopterin monophosphate synthase MoaC [Clostridia bacterium]|nr:cyclic pyranopterin monophosphate synthase MoaC [Clostridia bacterium]
MEFNHFDKNGNAIMVDVTGKEITTRTAIAEGSIRVSAEIIEAIRNGSVEKGDVLGVARVAGIMAAKRTPELIPMCHPLLLNKCSLDFSVDELSKTVTAVCTVRTDGKTGVEMEALTGVSVALLTIYDMCKAIDKRMCIENVHLVFKQGGKSGDFSYEN